jgi:carboxymethylenebutenolidase
VRPFRNLSLVCLLAAASLSGATARAQASVTESGIVISGTREFPLTIVRPSAPGRYPAVILLHSINGLERGYLELAERLAADGYVAVLPQWQAYARTPPDQVVFQLVTDTIAYLRTHEETDPERIALSGFCIGGRYTMLFLPQLPALKAGVAWYGFPHTGAVGGPPAAELIGSLQVPLQIIHGSADRPSPVDGIYRYAAELDSAGKYFELLVYQGQPHGFMLEGGRLSTNPLAASAYAAMLNFLGRYLH